MVPYALSKVVIALLSPLGTSLFLVTLGAALALANKARRVSTTLVVLGVVWLWTWSLPVAGEWLAQRVEADYPTQRIEALPHADAIVVLGGGMAPPGAPRPYPDLNDAGDRPWHAARLHHARKASLVIASGGSESTVTEADAMRTFMLDIGVPPAAIVLEGRSLNTQENAEFTAALAEPYGIRKILLVTSALHMRRAAAEFERVGFEVIPAATDPSVPESNAVRRWLPDTGALDRSGRAMKEVVGLLAVKMRPSRVVPAKAGTQGS